MRTPSAVLACIVLLGCASASGTMLSENVAVISTEGSAPRDRETMVRDALAEAARLTRAQGYRYFVVLSADSLTQTTTLKFSGDTYYDQFRSRWSRGLGNSGTLSGSLYPGEAYMTPDRTEERSWPALAITIRMYREGEIEPSMGDVWDATE